MKAVRLVLPFYVGFAVSSMLVFFFGDGGVTDYNRLLVARHALTENLQALKETHEELNRSLEKLTRDAETVGLDARALGYYREGERRLIIEGYSRDSEPDSFGRIVQSPQRDRRNTTLLRVLGFAVPAVLCMLILITRTNRMVKSPGHQTFESQHF